MDYFDISVYHSSQIPSTVHGDSGLSRQYFRYLFQKVCSCLELELPEEWDKNFFLRTLLLDGKLCVAEYDTFGVLPLNCQLSGYNVFYNPRQAIVTNPALRKSYTFTIGEDCELLYMTPDYHGIGDLISMYADLLACCMEAQAQNIVNSKLSFVFGAKNRSTAESYKKMFDSIQKGDPAVFVDRALFDKDGQPTWATLSKNLSGDFIAPDISTLMSSIEARFDAEFGITSPKGIEKKECLITAEVESEDAQKSSRMEMWLETLNEQFKKIEEKYGVHCSIKLRGDQEGQEEQGGDEDDSFND